MYVGETRSISVEKKTPALLNNLKIHVKDKHSSLSVPIVPATMADTRTLSKRILRILKLSIFPLTIRKN
jgi:hypothetical protein